MRKLDALPEHESKDGYLHRVCIPCIYNGGRRATVRATITRPDIIHISIDTDSGRPYQVVEDGYLHLNIESIQKDLNEDPENWVMGYRHKEALEMVEMIKGINTHYFAGTLKVLSDDKAIKEKHIPRERKMKDIINDVVSCWNEFDKTIDAEWLLALGFEKPKWYTRIINRIKYAARQLKKQYDRIQQVVPLAEAHLGGTWQRFYTDSNWLEEAETLKGGRIYLA